MSKELISKEVEIIDETSIKNKIYIVRGVRVMLDFELAEIYGYSTKAFNQQVKNNIEKFKGFMFKLNINEMYELTRSKFLTPIMQEPGVRGGRTYLPYAFTEQGIYMLMTVLRGPLAIEQSRKLVTIFKDMKDYIETNNYLLPVNEVLRLSNQVNQNTTDIKEVKDKLSVVMDNFIDPSKYKEFLILNGKKFEADIAYQTIYKSAKKTIYIIDDYIGIKTFELLKEIPKSIQISIYSDNVNRMSNIIIEDFIKERGLSISIYKTNHQFHDRFIYIDNKSLYISGPSSKDAANSIGMILEITNIKMKEIINREIKKLTH